MNQLQESEIEAIFKRWLCISLSRFVPTFHFLPKFIFFQLKLLGGWLRDCIDQIAQGLDHRKANQRLRFFGGIYEGEFFGFPASGCRS